MVRGIEWTAISRDRRDRPDFLEWLAAQVTRHTLTVYAWALLPNHAQLLLRTGTAPLARPMRALPALIARVAARWALPPAALTGGARRRPIPTARAVVCALACNDLALPAAAVARALGVSGPAVLHALPRGRALVAAQPAVFQALMRAVLRPGH